MSATDWMAYATPENVNPVTRSPITGPVTGYNPSTLMGVTSAGNTMQYGAGYGQAAPGQPSSVTPMNPAGQSTGSTIDATAPASIQSFGGTAQVAPTYANAATQGYTTGNASLVNPAQNDAYLQQYQQLLGTSLAPTFEQQDQQLAQSNAARGITNSGSAGQLQTQLQGQQAAALASGLEPLVSQGYGYTQQDIQGNQNAANTYGLANLGYTNSAQGQNAAYQQQANLANSGYGNEASVYNANAYNTDVNANASAYNNYQNELLGYGSGEQNALLSAYLNSYGPNTGVESVANTGAGNTGSVYGNVFGQQLNNQNQAYNQLGQDAGAAFGG